ncbi:MAG: GC-type dockerin domain-anchored protein [Planctomycetota bacterium]|nr:GC-type dockerin domain-anchored protein [Planctomycetota bacterium]
MNAGSWALAVASSLACSASALAQCPGTVTFQHLVGTQLIERGEQVVQTRDGGYITIGSRQLTPNNSVVWIVRYDRTGATLWERHIDDPAAAASDRGFSIVQTFDDGFAFTADSTALCGGLLCLNIGKLDAAGNFLWGRVYFGDASATPFRGSRIREAGNRDLVVVSRYNTQAGATLPSIIRTTALGSPVFAWGYSLSAAPQTTQGGLLDFRFVANGTPNPDLLAVGWIARSTTAPRDVFLLRTNVLGNVINAFTYNEATPLNLVGNGIDFLPAGEIALSARNAATTSESYSFRLTPAGAPISMVQYLQFDVANASLHTAGPEIWFAGTTLPLTGASSEMALVRAGTPGNVLSATAYGGSLNEVAFSLAPADADSWTLTGSTRSFTAVQDDLYLVKTNCATRSGCNETPYQQPWMPRAPRQANPPIERRGLQFANWIPNVRIVQSFNFELCLTCPADVNGDGVVDFFDFLDFAAAYSASAPSADFNGDGVIDFFDFLDFAAFYSSGC